MELAILEGLEDIRAVNAVHSRISPDTLLQYHLECMKQSEADMQKTDIELDPDEEEILDMLILKASGLYIKRIDDHEDALSDKEKVEDPWEMDAKRKQALDALGARSWTAGTTNAPNNKTSVDSTSASEVVVTLKANSKPKAQIRVTAKK
jgi:hypothetical protein